jgi:hypothetical protein
MREKIVTKIVKISFFNPKLKIQNEVSPLVMEPIYIKSYLRGGHKPAVRPKPVKPHGNIDSRAGLKRFIRSTG